jgi:hypothetical protein
MSDSGTWLLMALVLLVCGVMDCAMIASHRDHGTGPFKGCVCDPKEAP